MKKRKTCGNCIVLGHLRVFDYGVVKRLERVDRLLEDLHDGDAAHVFGSGLGHVHLRLHVALHKMCVLASHHGEHARDSEDGRNQACEPHAPVEDEQRDHKA